MSSDQKLVCIKHVVGDSQNTTNYLFATASVQDSNNCMFRPFPVAIIRLYIPSFKSMYNKLTRLFDDISTIVIYSIQFKYYAGYR
jgi:hypothetical protein